MIRSTACRFKSCYCKMRIFGGFYNFKNCVSGFVYNSYKFHTFKLHLINLFLFYLNFVWLENIQYIFQHHKTIIHYRLKYKRHYTTKYIHPTPMITEGKLWFAFSQHLTFVVKYFISGINLISVANVFQSWQPLMQKANGPTTMWYFTVSINIFFFLKDFFFYPTGTVDVKINT